MTNECIVNKAVEAKEWFAILSKFLTGNEERTVLRKRRPDWVFSIVQKCLNGRQGNDWTYKTIREALDIICDYDGDVDTIIKEQMKPDTRAEDIINWSKDFIDYIDDALDKGGFRKYYKLLEYAQRKRKLEILSSVIKSLEQLCDCDNQ